MVVSLVCAAFLSPALWTAVLLREAQSWAQGRENLAAVGPLSCKAGLLRGALVICSLFGRCPVSIKRRCNLNGKT